MAISETAPSFDPVWDERARGPRMSNVTGLTIHKYQMPVLEEFVMRLPRDALPIRVADQGGLLWMWCMVDTNEPFEERRFRAFKTGAAIPDDLILHYIGWVAFYVQMEIALYVFEELGGQE